MAPPRWTTEEELTFLRSWAPRYKEMSIQPNPKWNALWAPLFQAWFHRFPVAVANQDGSSEAERQKSLKDAYDTKREKIKRWFSNHGRGQTTTAKAKSHGSLLTDVRTRRPQLLEIYSRQYYEAKCKPIVKSMTPEGEKAKITDIRAVIREQYEMEPDSVKEEIQRLYEEEQARSKRSGREAPTPQDMQNSLDVMPARLSGALETLRTDSGWVYFTVGAGPIPAQGGKIGTVVIHSGVNLSGDHFGNAMPKFKENVVQPFAAFAKTVFPPEIRALRSLKMADDDDGANTLVTAATAAAASEESEVLPVHQTLTPTTEIITDSADTLGDAVPNPETGVQDADWGAVVENNHSRATSPSPATRSIPIDPSLCETVAQEPSSPSAPGKAPQLVASPAVAVDGAREAPAVCLEEDEDNNGASDAPDLSPAPTPDKNNDNGAPDAPGLSPALSFEPAANDGSLSFGLFPYRQPQEKPTTKKATVKKTSAAKRKAAAAKAAKTRKEKAAAKQAAVKTIAPGKENIPLSPEEPSPAIQEPEPIHPPAKPTRGKKRTHDATNDAASDANTLTTAEKRRKAVDDPDASQIIVGKRNRAPSARARGD